MAITKGVVTMTATREQADGYFRWCPQGQNNDGYINVGSSHWFFVISTKPNGVQAPICSAAGGRKPRRGIGASMTATESVNTKR
jgi:hypothetical protein